MTYSAFKENLLYYKTHLREIDNDYKLIFNNLGVYLFWNMYAKHTLHSYLHQALHYVLIQITPINHSTGKI